jgi:hypothetical protein
MIGNVKGLFVFILTDKTEQLTVIVRSKLTSPRRIPYLT